MVRVLPDHGDYRSDLGSRAELALFKVSYPGNNSCLILLGSKSYPALGVFEHVSRHVIARTGTGICVESKTDQFADWCRESTQESRTRPGLQWQCSPTIECFMWHVILEIGRRGPKTRPKALSDLRGSSGPAGHVT